MAQGDAATVKEDVAPVKGAAAAARARALVRSGAPTIEVAAASETTTAASEKMGAPGAPQAPPTLGAPRRSRDAPRQCDSCTGSENMGAPTWPPNPLRSERPGQAGTPLGTLTTSESLWRQPPAHQHVLRFPEHFGILREC